MISSFNQVSEPIIISGLDDSIRECKRFFLLLIDWKFIMRIHRGLFLIFAFLTGFLHEVLVLVWIGEEANCGAPGDRGVLGAFETSKGAKLFMVSKFVLLNRVDEKFGIPQERQTHDILLLCRHSYIIYGLDVLAVGVIPDRAVVTTNCSIIPAHCRGMEPEVHQTSQQTPPKHL